MENEIGRRDRRVQKNRWGVRCPVSTPTTGEHATRVRICTPVEEPEVEQLIGSGEFSGGGRETVRSPVSRDAYTYSHRLILSHVEMFDMSLPFASVLGQMLAAWATLPLQLGGLLETQLGQLLVAVVAIGVVVLVGRIVLKVAWRLVTIAVVIIALLFLLSTLGINVL